ncbi:MAG: ATP-binding protein [Thermoleophilaceae bacterium]
MEEVPEGQVDARPEKRFFVDMLTRDIELAPAIIDLVDNSIDGAKRLRPDEDAADRFAGLWVRMLVDPERFELLDSCGGFDREHARQYAFKFGRHSSQPGTAGEVGQFGVGMKRAIFKLGRKFVVASTVEDDGWIVDVDVDTWLYDEDNWFFPLADANGNGPDVPGTLVRCERLLQATSSRLAQAAFVSRVLSEISMRHAIALQQKLAISVNDRPLVPRPPALLTSEDLGPIAFTETLTGSAGAEVHMALHAGLAMVAEGEDDVDTDDPELFTGSDAAGWYVFCNGRALLFADRSRLTGWGEEVPRFHPQYRRFRGYVNLTGDSASMPWNTTKTAVDEDSEIWAQTRRHMVHALRESVRVLNRVKREVQQLPPEQRPLVSAIERSQPAALDVLTARRSFELPNPAPRVRSDAKKISYSVSGGAFARAVAALETERPAEIGQRTFRYYMRREVDRDFDE